MLDKEIDTESANVGSIAERTGNPRPTITSMSIDSIPQSTQNSNPSQHNNSDSSTLYNATVRTAEKAIKGYRGVKMDDKSYAAIAKKVMRRFDISEKHEIGNKTWNYG